MNPHIIYRIEAPKSGNGMYCNMELELDFHGVLDLLDVSYTMDMHPTPRSDSDLGWSKLRSRRSWYFGFASLDQLMHWTMSYPVRVCLGEVGYVVRVYTCAKKDIKYGKYQVIFKRKNAQLLDTLSLNDNGPYNLSSVLGEHK